LGLGLGLGLRLGYPEPNPKPDLRGDHARYGGVVKDAHAVEEELVAREGAHLGDVGRYRGDGGRYRKNWLPERVRNWEI